MSIFLRETNNLESQYLSTKPIYRYCPICKNEAWSTTDHEYHFENSGFDKVSIDGVAVIQNIISPEEEERLVKLIDEDGVWVPSQEGRAKQDFGPKVNFLGKKCSKGNFVGFPVFARDNLTVIKQSHPNLLGDFIPVEFCLLEYLPERGSYIRPHFDDTWIWLVVVVGLGVPVDRLIEKETYH